MTYEEALEIKLRMCDICRNEAKPTKASCENCSDKVAIVAISKQIAKKPKVISDYGICCNTEKCGFIFAFTENTLKVMGDLVQYDYCPCCGQRIDFSDYK